MQSSNPVLTRPGVFGGATQTASAGQLQEMYDRPSYVAPPGTARMTIDDVVAKTALMFVALVAAASVAWVLDLQGPWLWGSALVGFGLAMVNVFKKVISPPLVLAYAAVEGVFLGIVSHIYGSYWDGIVLQAVLATAATFAVMLVLYRSGRLRATPMFRKVLTGALIGYVAFLLVNFLLNAAFNAGVDMFGNGILPLAISVFAVSLASLFLILDFDEIEKAVAAGVPEQESWRAAFGLVVTLIWLYIEMLRLIAILRSE